MITRRAMLGLWPAAAVPSPRKRKKIPVGWSNQVVVANLVVIEGPDDGLFMYNGTPALGNLAYSVANAAGNDSSFGGGGNAFLPGSVSYGQTSGTFYAVQQGPTGIPGTAPQVGFYTAPGAGGPWSLQAQMNGNTSGDLVIGVRDNILLTKPSFLGTPPWTQVDAPGTPYTTALGPADLTLAWSVPNGEGTTGTVYTIETHLTIETGATTAETFTIGADINSGTLIPLATLGAAFNGSALNAVYDIPVRLRLIVNAVGVNTPLITLLGPLGDTSASRLATNSANMAGRSGSGTWNPASSNTIALYGVWGGAGGAGQSAQSYYSEFTRSGN